MHFSYVLPVFYSAIYSLAPHFLIVQHNVISTTVPAALTCLFLSLRVCAHAWERESERDWRLTSCFWWSNKETHSQGFCKDLILNYRIHTPDAPLPPFQEE